MKASSPATTAEALARALDPYMPGPEHRFYSVGATCQHLNCNPAQLRVLMEAAGVRFAEVRDRVPYFDGAGFDAVVKQYHGVVKEIESAAAAAANN